MSEEEDDEGGWEAIEMDGVRLVSALKEIGK